MGKKDSQAPVENLGASQVVLMVKNLPASAEDTEDAGSIPGSRCYILIIIIYFIVY